jgi:hypothetical protein
MPVADIAITLSRRVVQDHAALLGDYFGDRE